jgi:hypothetical protein
VGQSGQVEDYESVGTVKKFQKVSKVSKRGNFRRRKNCPK